MLFLSLTECDLLVGDERRCDKREPGSGGAGAVRPLPQGVLLHAPRHEQLLQCPEVGWQTSSFSIFQI
jgi:hypothetical protein